MPGKSMTPVTSGLNKKLYFSQPSFKKKWTLKSPGFVDLPVTK